MFSSRAISRIALSLSVLSWIALVLADLSVLFSTSNQLSTGFTDELSYILYSLYLVSLFFFFRYRIEKAESFNFVDLLWRVFVTGLVTTVLSLSIKSLDLVIGKLGENPYVINVFYLANVGLAGAFIISTFLVWKRLILYQKSKLLLRIWQVFEYGLFASLGLQLLPNEVLRTIYPFAIALLAVIGIILSVNMKWVAYLNFKQKWKSILLTLLIMLYLGYFYINIRGFEANEGMFTLHHNTVLLNTMFIFIFAYALFSVLVILFNLPTSSVFEQKLGEVVSYQRISQSIQTEQDEEKVYEILLDSAVSTVFADAGWIETAKNGQAVEGDVPDYSPYGESLVFYKYQIEEEDITEIKDILRKNKVRGVFEFSSTDRSINYSKYLTSLRHSQYKSILSFPIEVQSKTIGALVLLKDVSDGFNKEMAEITHTFVNQAGISIENFRLLTSALENERYQEELKIAKEVQKSLLPGKLASGEQFTISAFSNAADEVGGDYYDSYAVNPERTAMIIGDVSGKGTSAAFNMSQMKGVFNSLSQLDLDSAKFFSYANRALSGSLEKTSFITASYFIIDQTSKEVDFTRAGHCPTLYYNRSKRKAEYFESKGLGLGIIRDDSFADYLESTRIPYHEGDIMVLFTDGITEAKNFKREEYGYDRLQKIVEKHNEMGAEDIKEAIIESLYEFTDQDELDDDYTLVIVKFK